MLFLLMGLIFLGLGIYFAVASSTLALMGYIFIGVGGLFTVMGLVFRKAGGNQKKLMATGVPGVATIISTKETNMRVNDRPVVAFELEIAAPGVPVYRASTRTVLSFVTVGQADLRPGAKLAVKVDPAKPQNFMIDWNASMMQQPAQAPSAIQQ